MPPKQLLLATDLSSRCDRALDRALALAAAWDARLAIVHALEPPAPVRDAPSWHRTRDRRELAAGTIRAMLPAPRPAGVEVFVEWGNAASVVLDAAARCKADLVVTGLGREATIARAVLGSTLDTLLRRALAPVLAVKARARGPYRNIVVATDFSDGSRRALDAALAMFPEAPVRLFHAYRTPYESLIDDKAAAREGSLAYARKEAAAFLAGIDRRIGLLLERGGPEDLLGELVELGGVDLVVAGTSGRGRVASLFLGSVAQALVAGVPGDVMIVGSR